MGKEAAPGDVVALHGGGPDLTVLRVYSDVDSSNGIRVADLGWFTAAGEYRTGTLPLAVLRLRGGAERVGSDAELHANVAHPDFEYDSVTFVGRAADLDVAPNTGAGETPWMRNPHRYNGCDRGIDRQVTYWMRRRAAVSVEPPTETPRMGRR